jgi:hypothetical protein
MVRGGTLERFVRPRVPGEEEAMETIFQAGRSTKKVVHKRKGTPWSNWDADKKQKCASIMVKHGYRFLRNQYGSETPPASTVRTWIKVLTLNGQLRPAGRPKWLTPREEDQVHRSVVGLRRHGYIVDRETLIVMAHTAVKVSRGDDCALPPLTLHWAKSFRRRYQIGRLRQSTTERPPLTADSWDAVNRWRAELNQIQQNPASFGIAMPSSWTGGLPDELVLGVDETPLHYIPASRGTYVTGAEEAVFIAGLLTLVSPL